MASRHEDSEGTSDFLDELPNFGTDFFSGEEKEEHLGRFVDVTDKDVDKLIEGEENSNTKRKTNYDFNLIKTFLIEERSEIRDSEKIPSTDLDSHLSQFVLAARTKTGKDHEPSSLRGNLLNIERYLFSASYGKAIFDDSELKKKKTRDALKAKPTELKRPWSRKHTKCHNSSY